MQPVVLYIMLLYAAVFLNIFYLLATYTNAEYCYIHDKTCSSFCTKLQLDCYNIIAKVFRKTVLKSFLLC